MPLLAGIVFLVPILTYFAERYHNGFSGSYLAQYRLFFTKATDLTGYRGGFTPAHLWFLLFLYAITLLAIPVAALIARCPKPFARLRAGLPFMLLIGLAPALGRPFLSIGGKSLAEYFIYYLIGYYLFDRDRVIDLLVRRKATISILALLGTVCHGLLVYFGAKRNHPIIYRIEYQIFAWLSILFLFSFFARCMNREGRLTRYLSKASFSIYLFHLPCVVASAYLMVQTGLTPELQMIGTLSLSVAETFLVHEILKRSRLAGLLFGIKR